MFSRTRDHADSIAKLAVLVALAACSSNDWEIEGTVRSATTNDAVYRAKVSLACGAHGAPDARDMTTQTDDRGRYKLAGKGSNPADCSVKIDEERFIRQETKLSEGAFKKGSVGGHRLALDSALTPRK
jgi:hypothetical protein